MATQNVTMVYLASSDQTNPNTANTPSVGKFDHYYGKNGNADTDFQCYFPAPIDFSEKMEVALTQLSFVPATEGDPIGDGNSINDSMWVYCDIVDSGKIQVGSQRTNLLAKDLPAKHATHGDQGQAFGHRVQIDVQYPKYVPVMGRHFPKMGIQIRSRSGLDPWFIYRGDDPANPYLDTGTTAVLHFRPLTADLYS